jgi:hypothetical protein
LKTQQLPSNQPDFQVFDPLSGITRYFSFGEGGKVIYLTKTKTVNTKILKTVNGARTFGSGATFTPATNSSDLSNRQPPPNRHQKHHKRTIASKPVRGHRRSRRRTRAQSFDQHTSARTRINPSFNKYKQKT